MSISVRPITEDELEVFRRTMGIPFGSDPTPDSAERFSRCFELDRLRAAFDGSDMVATFGAFTMQLTVPGGRLPMAGTTVVTVLPTHRRQGILRRMMTEHLHEVHERGEPVAGLWASESSIYGRFGYGSASEFADMTLDKPWARFREPIDIRGAVRLIELDEALKVLPPLYDRIAAQRPGMTQRPEHWWEFRTLADPPDSRDGSTAHRRAVCTRDGEAVGYVIYRWNVEEEDVRATVHVVELLAVDTDAELTLWQFLFGTDLVTKFHDWNHPIDSPLHWQLEHPRRAKRVPSDGLWLRVLDIPRTLTSRRYSAIGRLALRINDTLCPWNDATWELEVDESGNAKCRKVEATPELAMTIETFGSVFLGNHRFCDLARAGLIEADKASLAQADAVFAWNRRPWIQEIF